ncbi:12595_t:CDS:2 [Ambispora leptoticha]|uniref:histidine--tRNA ligase n=1 Tax=Ambispora leptoticha TaxID=144679 RepID=A0A9N9BQ29_9GLOM|nr:12595_t:CDS:2 [Ambispora leptoticha]
MNTGKTATGKDYVKDEIISVSISLREPPLDDEKIDLVLKLPNLSEAEFENYSPEIEKAKELFTSSLGSTTDIIHKEMYTFLDRKDRVLALRPEGTASTVRLVCQNNLIREGVELVNAEGVIADYQILKLVTDILHGLGIKNFHFRLNYLGDVETKERYRRELKKFIEKNPLVRGLDYYTGLVFEVDLGEKKSILGGGRYDNLYQEVGDISAPAIGFAIGIERLVDHLGEKGLLKVDNKKIDVFFLATHPEVYLDILV